MYKVIKTNDGFMVEDQYEGEYIHDEHGNNLFDSEYEAQQLMTIAGMRGAIDAIFIAVEEGDAETIAHLAISYKQLFGTKEKVNE